ncbi:rRNA biogenesis protein rrp5, partial [Coemansia nantahalensis]
AKDAIDKCKPDAALAACVLDVDVEKSIVDYSLRTALVAGGTGKAGRATAHAALARALAEGRETQAVVEVVKEDYLVLSLPLLGNAIAFAVAKSFNDRSKPFMRFKVGQRLSGSLVRAEPNRRALVLLRPAPTAPARTGSAGSSADKRAAKDPVDPAISFFEDFQPGLVTQARVQSIKGVQANLDLAANIKGRLHITELVDGPIDAAVASPADAFAAAGVRAGETVQVKVLGWHDAKVYKYLPITHRASPMKTVIETTIRPAALAADGAPPALSLKTIKPGQVFNGFVKGIREQAAKGWTEVQVVLGPALVGHLPIQAATSSHAVAANPGRYFVAGTSIEVQVASVD